MLVLRTGRNSALWCSQWAVYRLILSHRLDYFIGLIISGIFFFVVLRLLRTFAVFLPSKYPVIYT